jgi:DNA-binding MarR family transcriptional regulator
MSGDEEAKFEESSDQLGPILEFMKLLWAVDHGLQSASKRMEASFGITGPQRLVVRIVGRFPGISAGALADVLHVHPSTLTGVLRRLEARGVVQRRGDPKDGRRALFGLTMRGKKLDTLRTGLVEQAVKRALARLPSDIAASQRMLAVLASELERNAEEQA